MKIIEVVAGVLKFENNFLCVQRGPSKYDYIHHKFEFPGGKIEENESHEIALKRELYEELNIDSIKIINKIITVEHQYPDFKLIMHAYLCIPRSNQLTLKEHIDYKWLNVSEMDTLDWAAADMPILKELK
jgi:8-oxo-dGTP diphosphatase